MNCKYHDNIKATNTCNICGEWICENCVLEINGRVYCKDCLKNQVKNNNFNQQKTNFYDKYEDKNIIYEKRKDYTPINKSGFLTFLFCILPGASQMYLGYTKRGMIIFLTFLLGVYVDALYPLTFIAYLFGFFDAFKIKSNLERGIYQEDNVNDIKGFLKENKVFIFIVFLIIVIPAVIEFFDDIFDDFFDGFGGFFNRLLFYADIEDILMGASVLIVCFTFFIIICAIISKTMFSKNKNKKPENIISTIENNKTQQDNKMQ